MKAPSPCRFLVGFIFQVGGEVRHPELEYKPPARPFDAPFGDRCALFLGRFLAAR